MISTTFVPPTNVRGPEGENVIGKLTPSMLPRTAIVCVRVPQAGGSFSITRPTNAVFASSTVSVCAAGKTLFWLSQ